jgi:hypothetical protein
MMQLAPFSVSSNPMGGVDLSEMVQDVLVVCVVGLNFCAREAGYINAMLYMTGVTF